MTQAHSALESRIRALDPWFHDLELDGIHTASDHFLWGYPGSKWEKMKAVIPDDLSGMSVLDIGCNAGYFSFEMKRRGAERVVGIDSDPRYLDQAALASEVLGLPIELRQLDVYDVAKLGERFDLVLFLGVFYHLRHPLLALDLIQEHVAKNLLLFATLQRGEDMIFTPANDYDFFDESPFTQPGFPRLHFVEQRYAGDPTNWFIPNRAASEAMLRSSGYEVIERAESDVVLARVAEPSGWHDGPRAAYPARGPREAA